MSWDRRLCGLDGLLRLKSGIESGILATHNSVLTIQLVVNPVCVIHVCSV
jgi:hypothetical protein